MFEIQEKRKYIVFLVISSLFLLFLLNEARKEITGLISEAAFNVTVKSVTRIRVTAFDYPVYVNLTQRVNITIEVQNSGSTLYNEKIEVFIKNSTMSQLAHYYDAIARLDPGERKSFKIIYVPPDYGIYYIQLRVSYAETKRLETWGVFIVSEEVTYNQTITPITIPGTGAVVGAEGYGEVLTEGDFIRGFSTPKREYFHEKLDIKTPDKLEISRGESFVTYIKVKNEGNSSLYSLKIITDTENILVDVFPKNLIQLPPGNSSLFMLSITVPFDIKPDLYPLDLEISSNEIKEKRKIILNVTDLNLKDIVYQMIINYKFIILELENEILEASNSGIIVSDAQMKLEGIKLDMDIAEDYYDDERYSDAYEKLEEMRLDIQDLLMSFALINIPKSVFLRASNVIIIISVVLLIIVIVSLYLLKRSREKLKRPKMLRESLEEAQNI